MRLDSCPLGIELEVRALDVPAVAQLRLREVGLRVGTMVRVTHQSLGGRVLAIGASRIAIDSATAALVRVALAVSGHSAQRVLVGR
jgi:ferrous iron transport protein A